MRHEYIRNGIKERFYAIPSFLKCSRCLGLAWAKDGRPVDNVFCGNRKINVIESFLYLGNGISPSDGYEVNNTARVHSAWGKFCE